MRAHRVAAVFYGAWGALHVAFGLMMLIAGLSGTGGDAARIVATAAPEAVGEPAAAVGGIILQHAWNLLMFGVIVGALAVWNWRREALVINTVIASAADIGFIAFVLIPGHITLADGLLGPILWIGGVIATGFALADKSGDSRPAATA